MTLEAPSRTAWSLIASLLLLTAGLAGCVQEAEAAHGEIHVKDDELAEEAEAVHVEFTQAEVLPAGGTEWQTVYEGNASIELLSLSEADAREQLAAFEIEPGEYDHLRLRITNVTVEHGNGTSEELLVHGNVVTVAEDITYEPGEDLQLLLDFDLENGVNLTAGEYTPVVGDLQRSDVDSDDDGEADLNDTDDGDGTPDHVDEDRDGDGETDVPEQAQAYDERGLRGLCTAWESNEQGRENGTVEANATAFQWLQNRSAEEDMTVEEYCEANTGEGAPDEIGVRKDELPEKAQQAIGDRHIGPPDDRPGAGEDRGQDQRGDDRGADRGSDERSGDDGGNATARDQAGDERGQDARQDRQQDEQGQGGNGTAEERP